MGVAERIDFNKYKHKSQWTIVINEGMKAGYDGKKAEDNPYLPRDSEQCQAWHYGWMGSQSRLNGSVPMCCKCLT